MKKIHILLVEDNEADIMLTTDALQEGKICNTVSVAKDGKQAIDFLIRYNNSPDLELPNLILLDVNLPKKMVMRCYTTSNQVLILSIFQSLCLPLLLLKKISCLPIKIMPIVILPNL